MFYQATRNWLLGLMFFTSGFCGLLYQIVWLRLAFANFGVITPVISVVISVFMFGLGLGSWLSGELASKLRKTSTISAIIVYGLIEGIIAIGAVAVPELFAGTAHLLLNVGDTDSWLYLGASAAAILISILPWTTAMGMTYPVALLFFQEFSDFNKHRFSQLYVFNTAGAMTGAAVTVWYLIELLGFRKVLLFACALNTSIALIAISWGLLKGLRKTQTFSHEQYTDSHVTQFDPAALRFNLIVLFLTGLCSMAMEVVWIRAFSSQFIHSVYAFALLLVFYLMGNSIGAAIYGLTIGLRRVLPTGLLLGAAAITACFPLLLGNRDWASSLSPFQVVCMIIVLLPLAIGSFAAVLGYLTPKLIDEISRSSPERAGRAYAINIAGCIVGPLIAGYILLPLLGTRLTMMLLAIPLVVLSLSYRGSTMLKGATLAVCALAFLISLSSKSWEEGSLMAGRRVMLRDYTATVIASDSAGLKRLSVNGQPMTTLSSITKLMAHLPAVFHGKPPVDVLVICLGMGTTYRSALTWGSNVTVVELVPSVRDVLPFFHPDGEKLLHHPRGAIIVDDGRRFLCRTKRQFDVIIIDPPPPSQHPASSLLYSVQFYDLLKRHLKPGGIVAQWDGGRDDEGHILQAFTRSMVQSFPYVRSYGAIDDPDKLMWGTHFLCSMQPLPRLTTDEFFSRMPSEARRDLEEWLTTTNRDEEAKTMIAQLLSREKALKLLPDADVIVTDDRPFNEYFLVRQFAKPTGQH